MKQQILANGKLKTDISGISSDPGDMSQADNALLNRDGIIEARHGHQRVPFTTGSGDGASGWSGSLFSEDFISFTQTDSSQVDSTYYPHSVFNGTSRKLAIYSKTGSNLPIDNTFSFANSSAYQSGAVATSKASTGYSVQPTSQLFTANNKLFAMTDNGLYGGDVRDGNLTLRKEINAGWMEYATTVAVNGDADKRAKNWMNPDKMISCKFVIEEETGFATDTSRRVVWSVSRELPVMLTDVPPTSSTYAALTSANAPLPLVLPIVRVSFGSTLNTSSVPDSSRFFLKVYRTLQYDVGEPSPARYFLAAPEKLLNTTNGTSNTLGDTAAQKAVDVILEYNDTFIRVTEELYTAGSNDVGREHVTPYPAAEIIDFKGHTVYGNIYEPPVERFNFIQAPAAATHNIRIRAFDGLGTTLSESVTNAAILPTTASKTTFYVPSNNTKTSASADVRGTGTLGLGDYATIQHYLSTLSLATTAVTLVVPLAEDNESNITRFGLRPYFSTILAPTFIGTGASRHVRVTPAVVSTGTGTGSKTAQQIDINKFGTRAGLCAIVNHDSSVATIFSYKSVTLLSTTGQLEFSECNTVLGDGFANISAANLTRYFYFLPGVSANNIPLYINATSGGFVGITPIPGNNLLTQTSVGFASRFSGTTNTLQAFVQYQSKTKNGKGLVYTPGDILNFTAVRFCDAVNSQSINRFIKAEVDTSSVGGFIIRAIDPQVTRITVEYLVSSTPTAGYLSPEAGATGGVETRGLRKSSGLVISNLDFPEQIARIIGGLEQPLTSIPSTETVMGFGKTNETLYILTDKAVRSMVLRTNDATGEPIVEQLQLIDGTTGCIAPGSIQSVEGTVVFLSPTGFQAIEGGALRPIGIDIHQEIRQAIAVASQASGPLNISRTRSFHNDSKSLYGCYIPGFGCYVLSTTSGRWSKWAITFDKAEVHSAGQLITTTSIYNSGSFVWQYMAYDKFTSTLPQNPVDQLDINESLAGATVTWGTGSVTIDRGLSTTPFGSVDNIVRAVEKAPAGSKVYYYHAASNQMYPGIATAPTATQLVITFTDTTLVLTPSAVNDRIKMGVPVVLAFQPHTADNAADLKCYMEWNTQFTAPVNYQSWEFRVDSTSSWVPGKAFGLARASQTMFRDFVPVQVGSGRWLERKLSHSYPEENFSMSAQTVVFRGVTGSNSEIGGS